MKKQMKKMNNQIFIKWLFKLMVCLLMALNFLFLTFELKNGHEEQADLLSIC